MTPRREATYEWRTIEPMDGDYPADPWSESCHRCGQPLGNDPDDEPEGGSDGLPLCGECARNRDEAADFEESGLGDGEIDRVIDDW